jgi:iron(III) transport system permease protein
MKIVAMLNAVLSLGTSGPRRLRLSRDELIARGGLLIVGAVLCLMIALPLVAFLIRSVTGKSGEFVGIANYASVFSSPNLLRSIGHSFLIGVISTCTTMVLACGFAYGLTRTCMWGKGALRIVARIPLLAPSLLPAISFIYLFGTQGVAKTLLLGGSIYGPIGIVMGEVFYTFPHAVLLLTTALSLADATLYEAGHALGASRFRIFLTVTLPGIRYGLTSAFFVVFTMAVTDFGIPKVIGGNFNVLATDVYRQVVGWQNFEIGSVIGVLLLLPTVLTFTVQRLIKKRHAATFSARAVPYAPAPNRVFDGAAFAFCSVIGICLLAVLAMAAYASFVAFWPYNLSLTLANYDFHSATDTGWVIYWRSFQLAICCAVFGTGLVFVTAYLVEKTPQPRLLTGLVQFVTTLPLAVPGVALGLAYVFFFNRADNPFHFIYGTMTILVLSAIAHFFTVAFLTATAALKQLDKEFEAVSASLKVSLFRTFFAVTIPACLPTIFDISIYFFVRAMTTVSGIVFLYSADTMVASVSTLYLDDNGITAVAAAMAMMIVYTSAAVTILHHLLTQRLIRKTQRWRC